MRSRLCDSRFASEEYRNLVGPVIRLKRLTDEELFALISRVTKLYAANYGKEPRITEEQMMQFLNLSLSRAGADQMITPREMLRDYMTVLNILMQNDNIVFEDVVNKAFGDALPSEEKDESPENPQEPQRNNYTASDIEF